MSNEVKDMPSKMISIREDIYEDLKRLKDPNESFSEVIERLITRCKKDPLNNYGIFNDIPKDVMDDFEMSIIDTKKEDAKISKKKISEIYGDTK